MVTKLESIHLRDQQSSQGDRLFLVPSRLENVNTMIMLPTQGIPLHS